MSSLYIPPVSPEIYNHIDLFHNTCTTRPHLYITLYSLTASTISVLLAFRTSRTLSHILHSKIIPGGNKPAESSALQQKCAPVTTSFTAAVVLQSTRVCVTAALLAHTTQYSIVFSAEQLGEHDHVGAAHVNVSQKNCARPASIASGKKEQRLSRIIGRVGGPGLLRMKT